MTTPREVIAKAVNEQLDVIREILGADPVCEPDADEIIQALNAAGFWIAPKEATGEMIEAGSKALGHWVEPYTAPREGGVPIETDITQEDADYINGEWMHEFQQAWTEMRETYMSEEKSDD